MTPSLFGVRQERIRLRRAGVAVWLVCKGCGRSGDIATDVEVLSAAEIEHSSKCSVARKLWGDLMPLGFSRNGHPWRRDGVALTHKVA